MSIVFLTVPSKTLAASIDAATYSFQPSDILGWDGNALTSGNFGSSAYVVFRSSDNKKMELMSIDPTTIASASITILKRGLSFSPTDLTTEVTANKQIWVKNDTIIEFGSNPPQLLEFLKEYIDAAAIAGGVPATTSVLGITKMSTAPVSPANPIAVGDNDIRVSQYVTDTGAANAYAIAPSPAITSYVAGQKFVFKAVNANTTASTLNVSALGTKTIKKNSNADLVANDILAGQVVVVYYDGTNFQMESQVGNSVPTVTTATVHNFTASGTWTKPAGLKYAIIEGVGAGGAGGGAAAIAGSAGAGGAAGGYARRLVAAASLGATETVTIGAGGTGISNGAGNTGGTTSFGAWISCTGGSGGNAGTAADGGIGGVGSSGDFNTSGGDGAPTGASANSGSGSGGASYFGSGAGGLHAGNNANGRAASAYGSGGGGSTSGGGASTGGAGQAGVVIVTEFYI